MWAARRRHTAEANARCQFARDLDAFVAKAPAFVDTPSHGVQSLTRANRLLYDPKSKVFAVVSRDGAPRTIFKPRDGASYWWKQKDRQAGDAAGGNRQGGSRRYSDRGRGRRSSDGADDQG